jgi:hypothetical protein
MPLVLVATADELEHARTAALRGLELEEATLRRD